MSNKSEYKLLSRDTFRKSVFERDNYICIIPGCNEKAVDAHHIIERRLWKDPSEFGGYFLCNGASLCEEHHIAAERNFFPPQYLWQLLNIDNPTNPKSFDPNIDYNKWGEPFKIPNRYKIKYPSTPYLPFSPQWLRPKTIEERIRKGDWSPDWYDKKFLENVDSFLGAPLVVTIKMDGSNVQLTKEHVAARNGTVASHKSFDYLKALHAQNYSHRIPEELQVFGEWLYAKHSIHYTDNLSLENYLQIFGVYNSKERMWGSWDDVVKMAWILDVPTVPLIKKVKYEKEWQFTQEISNIAQGVIKQGHEGIVIRIDYPFHYGQFSTHVAKYVRENHVQTDEHWSQMSIVRNLVKEGK